MAKPDRKQEGVKRCAIYTRKSIEDGLEQEFNSLDAQREACEAYIVSQRHEGWTLIPEAYDDGGYSGGSMDRPGLQQLLVDVTSGKVDVIVVYKVDRLTRSLADFAKIVDILDAKHSCFVSITQALNTTTSMGRLTLNVLLSFAQFEREVTGERIRDKIAASKKKGLWMGGPVPLGYDVQDRKLVVNQVEADTVRYIFRQYLETSSVRVLVELLASKNMRTKIQVRTSGPHRGGIAFGRGCLFHLLKNRTYLGKIIHKGDAFPGEHEPIVPLELWDRVEAKLAARAQSKGERKNSRAGGVLAGLLYDGLGRKMTPSHASKRGRRYCYYLTYERQRTDRSLPCWRVPAHDLEQLVVSNLQQFLCADTDVANVAGCGDAEEIQTILERARGLARALADRDGDEPRDLMRQLVARIDLHDDHIDIALRLAALLPGNEGHHQLSMPVERIRRGQVIKLVLPGPELDNEDRDTRLVDLVAEAHTTRATILEESGSLAQIATREGKCRGHLADMIRLSWLAPDIVTAIVEGRQPATLTRAKLMATKISPDWCEQRRQLGFA